MLSLSSMRIQFIFVGDAMLLGEKVGGRPFEKPVG